MRGLKILFGLLVGLSAAVAAAWVLLLPRIEESARVLLVRGLGSALDARIELTSVSLRAAPPTIDAIGLDIGEGGSLLRARELRLRILPFRSLRERKLACDVDASGFWIDVPALGARIPEDSEEAPIPALVLRAVELRDAGARVADGEDPIDLTADRLAGEAEIGAAAGGFRFRAEATALEVRHRSAGLLFERVALAAGDTGDGLTVEKLEAHGERIDIAAHVVPGIEPSHRLEMRVGLERLSMLDESFGGLGGLLSLQASLDGPLLDPAIDATMEAEDVVFQDLELGKVDAKLSRAGDRLELAALRAAPFGGTLGLEGRLGLSGAHPVELRAEWHDLELSGLAPPAFGRAVAGELRVAGTSELSATLRPWSLRGRASGALAAGQGGAPIDWTVEGGGDATAGHAELSLQREKAATARANVRFPKDGVLGGNLYVEVADLGALRSVVPSLPWPEVDGSFTVSGELGGKLGRPELRGKLAAERLSSFGVHVDRARGSFDVDPDRLIAEAVTLEMGQGRVVAGGTLALTSAGANDWRLSAERVPLDQSLWPALRLAGLGLPVSEGVLAAQVAGRGRWSVMALDGSLQIESFSLLGEPFERLSVAAKARLPEWSADTTLRHDAEAELHATVAGHGVERISATVESSPWALEKLERAEQAGLRGTVQVRGELRGPPRRLTGSGHLEGTQVSWKDRSIGDVSADAEGRDGRWRVSTGLLGDTLRVAGSIDQAASSFALGAEWNETDFGPLLGAGKARSVQSSGSLRLGGDLFHPLAADGDAVIEHLGLRDGDLEMKAVTPIRAKRTRGTLTIAPFSLAGNGTEVVGSGVIGQDGSGELSLQGHGSLELLELLGKPIRSARGTFQLRAAIVVRADSEPRLDGEISLDKAALDVGLPVGPTRTSGRFVLSGSTIQIVDLEGRLGGGTFSVAGSVDTQTGLELTWRVDEISTGLLPSLEHEISGVGTVRGPWDEPTVAGDVRILRMLYDRRIELTDFLPSFKRELASPPKARSGPTVRLDLHVTAPGEIFIDNNFARIEAAADLRVGGSVDRPRLSGPIEVLSGDVFFRGRTFEITNAVIEFQPKLRTVATINIQAESEIETDEETYTVTVRVEGTTEKYRVTMVADDASLTQTDVASLIGFGKTTAQLQEGGGGFPLSSVLALAPGHIEERAEHGAASFLRLDRFEFESAVSRETGQFEPQITLGKDLLEDLSATLTTTFGVNAGETLSLEYELIPGFSLLGSWESQTTSRDSAVAAVVKFRRRFRDLPGFSLLGSHRPEDGDAP